MKKIISLISIFLVGFLLHLQTSYAHSKKRTKYGSVQCLSPNGSVVSDSYCTAGNNAGSKPNRPSRRCRVSHTHQSPSESGGNAYVDVDGDGIAETAALDAPPGSYFGSDTEDGETDSDGETTVSETYDIWDGSSGVSVGGNIDGGINQHEDGPDAGGGIKGFIGL